MRHNQHIDPNEVFPSKHKSLCFIKNVVSAPNISIGDYTYYDDPVKPENFECNNILFNYPEFGDKLIIGKFCAIATGTKFMMGSANHRMDSVTTYPFNVFGGEWEDITQTHLSELPNKGDTIIGNDVWFGRECLIMPGVKIGDGAIIAARSVVVKDIKPYSIVGGNPARVIRKRFDDEMIELLLRVKWWDRDSDSIASILPLLCNNDLSYVKEQLEELQKI